MFTCDFWVNLIADLLPIHFETSEYFSNMHFITVIPFDEFEQCNKKTKINRTM